MVYGIKTKQLVVMLELHKQNSKPIQLLKEIWEKEIEVADPEV
jgi:hypothetical protein